MIPAATPVRTLATILTVVAVTGGCTDPERTDIAVGLLESNRVELRADAAEPVIDILVTEGDQVAAGDTLMRLDQRRSLARVDEARAALAEQQARIDELVRGPRSEKIAAARASLQAARNDREFRKLELARVSDLLKRNLTSTDSVDRARAAYDAARSEVDLRTAQLEELLAGTTAEELGQAEQRVAQAAARLEQARLDSDRLVLRAPAPGYVDSIPVEAGERPSPGQTLLVLLTGSQPYARVYVPEALRVALAPGTSALVAVDGLDAPLPGRIRRIETASSFTPYFALTQHDRGRLTYVAEVALSRAGDRLPDGVPVAVTFGGAPPPGTAGD